MKNLSLTVFNQAYLNIINTWGNLVETVNDGTTLFVTLENKCKAKDNIRLAFNQSDMSISTVGSCLKSCTCMQMHDRLIPLVEKAIVG